MSNVNTEAPEGDVGVGTGLVVKLSVPVYLLSTILYSLPDLGLRIVEAGLLLVPSSRLLSCDDRDIVSSSFCVSSTSITIALNLSSCSSKDSPFFSVKTKKHSFFSENFEFYMKIMYAANLVFNVMITVGIKEKFLRKINEHLFEIGQL